MNLLGIIITIALLHTTSSTFINEDNDEVEERLFSTYYKPINLGSTATTGTGTVTPVTAALAPFDQVCLDLINSFRTTHQAPRVTYNQTLATAATQCANDHARANSEVTPTCTACGSAVETTGISPNMAPSQRCRGAIADPVQLSWFSEYTSGALDFSMQPLMYSPAYADFAQMIWIPTKQVGCGTSSTQATALTPTNPLITAPQYIVSCCWDQGVVPATFAQNVKEDTV